MGILTDMLGTVKDTFKVGKSTLDAAALTANRTITVPDKDIDLGDLNNRFIDPHYSARLETLKWVGALLKDEMRRGNRASTNGNPFDDNSEHNPFGVNPNQIPNKEIRKPDYWCRDNHSSFNC